MSKLPHSDPSNPALPSPLFSDITAVRGDHMRANNAAIFADLDALNERNPELVALTGGSFKTAALANANTYNGRSLFTCTAGVADTPSVAAWRIIGFWNSTDSSGRFVAMADTSLETWEINYSGAAWGVWTKLTDSSGNLTRNVIGNLTGNVIGNLTGDVSGNAGSVTNGVYTSGNQTVAGVKTFSSEMVGSVTGHAHAIVETGTGAGVMRWKIIEIGDWKMNTTENVSVNIGVAFSKVRTVNVTIREDGGGDAAVWYLTFDATGTNLSGYWQPGISPSLVLHRISGKQFDSPSFDGTSYNRGWVTIGYID